ncbi:MAG: DNA polymerase III subunit delta [Clostridia bacterium]|nr:DNA polymerase III subunit delta [Clostridia bacterium]
MSDVMIGEIKGTKNMKAHLASGNYARAYLFYGEEEYLKDLYISRLKKAVVDDPMNIYLFTGKTDPKEIAEIVGGVSLFGERKLIIVSGSNFFKTAEPLPFMEDLEDGNCTIVFREETVDKRVNNYKNILKQGIVFECIHQTEQDVVSMLSAKAKEAGRTLSPGAAEMLLSGIGLDMVRLAGELEKLILFVEDGAVILPEHVLQVCPLALSVRVYDLSDAVLEGNGEKAFKMLRALLDEKQSALGILSLLSKNWISVYEAKMIVDAGGGIGDIQSALGVAPFFAKKYYLGCRNWNLDKLRKKIEMCIEMDAGIKSGTIKDVHALELLIT